MGFPKGTKIAFTKRIENGYWVGKRNRCPPQLNLPAFPIILWTRAAIFHFLPLHVMSLCLKCLSRTSTYQKFKVYLILYFLYVAYSLTTIIYYLYYSHHLHPTCIILHCYWIVSSLRDKIMPHTTLHTCTVFVDQWASSTMWKALCQMWGTIIKVSCCHHHYFLVWDLLHSNSNRYLLDLLEYLIVIRSDF